MIILNLKIISKKFLTVELIIIIFIDEIGVFNVSRRNSARGKKYKE